MMLNLLNQLTGMISTGFVNSIIIEIVCDFADVQNPPKH